jgi:hypothetical protein
MILVKKSVFDEINMRYIKKKIHLDWFFILKSVFGLIIVIKIIKCMINIHPSHTHTHTAKNVISTWTW